ncbi:MAG: MarR family transcriptional regulator [Flavobacteriales bacterium]
MKEKINIEFKNSLGPWIGRTLKLIEHRIEEILSQHDIDLSRMQFVVLKTIAENDGISQNELAFFAKRDKSSLTRMINTLINKGYINKCSSQEDKRKNHIHITSHGTEILEKAIPHFRKMAACIEQNLSVEEIETTKQILKKIQENVTDEFTGPFFN